MCQLSIRDHDRINPSAQTTTQQLFVSILDHGSSGRCICILYHLGVDSNRTAGAQGVPIGKGAEALERDWGRLGRRKKPNQLKIFVTSLNTQPFQGQFAIVMFLFIIGVYYFAAHWVEQRGNCKSRQLCF